MENKKVAIKSTVKAQVGINLPDLRLKRDWVKKGALQYINFEDLEQAIYDPGVEYLFKSGILYIEDMNTKIALGLEEQNTTQPTNIIVLDDAQKKRYLTVAPIHELKSIVEKISHDQLIELAHYAIELEVTDFERCDLLKTLTNIDIVKAVITNRETAALLAADKAAK